MERLGLALEAPSLEYLQQLVAAHVDRTSIGIRSEKVLGVAYENLDIQLGRPRPPLDYVESARRVLRRGGCLARKV